MKTLDELRQAFKHPAAEYTLMPFWFINGRLEKEELKRQIQDFKAKGVDGFVFHPRLGLTKDTPYLSDRYLDFVRFAVEQAREQDMRVVLYDEAMYPSGSAHGKVVSGNPEFAARAIRVVSAERGEKDLKVTLTNGESVVLAIAVRRGTDGTLDLGRTSPLQMKDGTYQMLEEQSGEWQLTAVIAGFSGGTIRGVHFGEDDGEPGAPKAADLLNPMAVKKFIHVTHDAYYSVLQEYFGTTIKAFFTDEPSLLGRCVDADALRPWTTDFMEWYQAQGNQPADLLAQWYDVGPLTGRKRRRFRQAVNKRLEQSYYAQLHDWCETHHIALTGHPAGSDDIGCLRYFQVPGQDVVWRWVAPENDLGVTTVHSTMAKCASDAARHLGRRRNGNECFGCCGPVNHPWDFSVDDMKWYFDWLFVRGTNLLYPHAFLYSVDGEARYNERPPDVGPNNSWWRYYPWIASYAKRLSWLNTDSVNGTTIAVLGEEDHLPWKMVRPLYEHQLEFNYLEDRLLKEQAEIIAGEIRLAKQHYKLLLVEDPALLDEAMTGRLKQFCADGGRVLVWQESDQKQQSGGAKWPGLEWVNSAEQLLTRLEQAAVRELGLEPASVDIRMTHVRRDDHDFYLITNEGEKTYEGKVVLTGLKTVERWDAWQGTCEEQPAEILSGNRLRVPLRLPRRASILYAGGTDDPAAVSSVTGASLSGHRSVQEQRLDSWDIVLPDHSVQKLPALQDWTEDTAWHDYYGTMSYQARIVLPARQQGKRVWLDLGQVGEIAEILLNGKSIGVLMWKPYELELTPYLQEEVSELQVTIRVTSSFSRKYTSRIRPSGLMGPVYIRSESIH